MQHDRGKRNKQERGGVRHTLELKWGRGFKIWVHDRDQGRDRGMTRVKVITDKHNQGCILDKTCEALSSNNDEKEQALKGRFKVSMWARA